jgi:hypothetical protein
MSATRKSPFPGMDPFLERRWGDVHHRLCTYSCDQLQEHLGGNFVARLGERVVVELPMNGSRSIYPDVRVVEHGFSGPRSAAAVMDIPVADPLIISFPDEQETQAFIEIIEPDSARLITAIEFLSPSNKFAGNGRDQYQRKQQELRRAKVSLVEIDLLRGGPRVFMLPEAQYPGNGHAEYAACVMRGYLPDLHFELYPMPLRQPLRPVRIPLLEGDADVVLDLQPLIEQAYRNGRYDRTDYTQPCIPPLQSRDVDWAADLLRTAGKIAS